MIKHQYLTFYNTSRLHQYLPKEMFVYHTLNFTIRNTQFINCTLIYRKLQNTCRT